MWARGGRACIIYSAPDVGNEGRRRNTLLFFGSDPFSQLEARVKRGEVKRGETRGPAPLRQIRTSGQPRPKKERAIRQKRTCYNIFPPHLFLPLFVPLPEWISDLILFREEGNVDDNTFPNPAREERP